MIIIAIGQLTLPFIISGPVIQIGHLLEVAAHQLLSDFNHAVLETTKIADAKRLYPLSLIKQPQLRVEQ